jgi:two-component system phosphate regulon sensor histidine kinase PhoR
MKTTAFLIRVAICLLFSLVPITELENRIYSARMALRVHWGAAPDLVILDVASAKFNDPTSLQTIQAQIQSEGPSVIFLNSRSQINQLQVDFDGMVRHSLPYSVESQGPLDPRTLAKMNTTHLINYVGPAGTFSHCAYSEKKIACPVLRGKIVLLSEKFKYTPIFHTPLGDMPASEVVANDIQTLIRQQFIYSAPFSETFLITLAMVLIGAFYIIYYPVMISAIATVSTGIVIVIFLFQLIFQLFAIYIPSANVICSVLVTYLIFTGYRLAIQENLQWRSLKQAQYLRELDRMKTNFLSIVSHDLNTPLAKIQAVVERLRREIALPTDERTDWKEQIDSIENSNNEMKRFITSILNLSRLESQKVTLNKKSNDINLLIQQALKRLKPLAQQKNLNIEESLDPLFSIECDEDLMRQVLTNLIDNAIKYSPAESKIIVRSREEDGFVRVEVEDFGPGIPKDQLPLMFRKFSRFLRPIKEQVKGTGLGLYLSKYFIELHGGTIRVKSVEGQGTTFSFTLPLHGVEGETILG